MNGELQATNYTTCTCLNRTVGRYGVLHLWWERTDPYIRDIAAVSMHLAVCDLYQVL